MSVSEAIPLMKPGSTVRNVVIAVIYLILLPFIVALSPLILAILVGTNHRGWADRLSSLPGVDAAGGVKSALVVGVVALVTLAVIGAALPGEDPGNGGGDGGAAATNGGGGGGSDGGNGGGAAASSPTNTPEPTPSPTPSEPVHQVGESFVVGSGEQQVEYTIENVRTAQNVGGQYGENADAQFVIVEMTLTNNAQESFTVDSNLYQLVDGQDRAYDVDTDAIAYAENSIIYEQVDPGVPKTGTVVFDVPADQSTRRLKIEPAGMFSTARTHYVVLK